MISPWIGLCVVATAVLVGAERSGPDLLRIVAKTTASLAFFAQAIHVGALQAGLPGALLLVALACSVAGDVCLLWRRSFVPGIGAFGLAHVAFVALFLAVGVSAPAAGVALLATGSFGFAVSRALAERTGRLRRVVEAYAVLLCTMTAVAIGAFAADPTQARGLLLAAAVVFLGSDLFVARDRFVARAWINRAIGLPMYYGAQLVLATVVPELVS